MFPAHPYKDTLHLSAEVKNETPSTGIHAERAYDKRESNASPVDEFDL